MAKKLYDEDGNEVRGKLKKPFYKRWWFIALVVFIVVVALTPESEEEVAVENESLETTESVEVEESEAEAESVEEEPDVPREHENALNKAQSYLEWAGMSEQGLREQLSFEDFPEEAINYAMANVDVDYNQQAIDKAKSYDEYHMTQDNRLSTQPI